MTTVQNSQQHFHDIVSHLWQIAYKDHYEHGRLEQAVQLLQNALPLLDHPDADPRDRCRLRIHLGTLLGHHVFLINRDAQDTSQVLHEALDLATSLDDQTLIADACDALGWMHHFSQIGKQPPDLAAARGYFEKAFTIRQAENDQEGIAKSHFHIGLMDQFTDNPVEALAHFEKSYDLAQKRGDQKTQSYAIRHIGFLKMGEEDYDEARRCLEISLNLREELGLKLNLPFSLQSLARVCMQQGELDTAHDYLTRARAIAIDVHNERARMLVALALGEFHEQQAHHLDARQFYTEARELATNIGHETVIGIANEKLSSIAEEG